MLKLSDKSKKKYNTNIKRKEAKVYKVSKVYVAIGEKYQCSQDECPVFFCLFGFIF